MHFLASWKRALGVDLISYRSQYHTVCIFLPWIRLSNEGVCWVFIAKSLCFFYFPLWPVRHFENSSRRACALRGVSGCVHLESRKTNVRRTGERVWYGSIRYLCRITEKSCIWATEFCAFTENECNKAVIELCVVLFWSEIILVTSNETRAAHPFDVEIMHMISDLIIYMEKLLSSDWFKINAVFR